MGDGVRLVRHRLFSCGHIALAAFEFRPLRAVLRFQCRRPTPGSAFSDIGRVRLLGEARLLGFGGFLSLADRGFASFRGGVALRDISLECLDRPKPLRRTPLGTKHLLCLVLESRAQRREAFLHLRDLSLLPLKLFALGRELPLSPPKVHLSLLGFAFRGANLPIFRGQIPCKALHPFRRPPEFLASALAPPLPPLHRPPPPP